MYEQWLSNETSVASWKAILGWAVLGKMIQTNRYFHNSNAQQDNRIIFLSLCQIDPRKINKQGSIHRFSSRRLWAASEQYLHRCCYSRSEDESRVKQVTVLIFRPTPRATSTLENSTAPIFVLPTLTFCLTCRENLNTTYWRTDLVSLWERQLSVY